MIVDTKYVRLQLAHVLKAVKSGSRSKALDALQRCADGLDHLEAALGRQEASESGVGAFQGILRLEYRHNNGYDSIILVNAKGDVRSDWTVTPAAFKDFCDLTEGPTGWDDRFGDEHKPEDYGPLVAVRLDLQIVIVDEKLWEDCTSNLGVPR